jgi:hypothetical protein
VNISEYFSWLDQHTEATSANLIEMSQWVPGEALPWLWNEVGGAILTPKRKHPLADSPPPVPELEPMKDPDAVRKGLFTSATDWKKKVAVPSFYRAQLTMLDAEANRYCRAITRFTAATNHAAAFAIVETLHRALLDMLNAAAVLLEDAGREVAGVPGYFGAWRRTQDHPFEVFKGAEQTIYGVYSGMTHADRAPYAPVAVLRTAIELRLRLAFGIHVLIDPANPQEPIPIDLSTLFQAIQTQQDHIDFAVDIHDIRKIYRWSNHYLHGGTRDYPWVPGFVLQYLRPIFADQQTENGKWNINGGIRMRRETWRAVREAVGSQFETAGLTMRFAKAWRVLAGKARRLELPACDEQDAHCVLSD